MNKTYYVYIYLDENGQPFYVGKGHGDRAYQHLKDAFDVRNKMHRINKIRKIQRLTGRDPIIVFYATDLTEEQAFDLEINLIKLYGRRDEHTGILINKTCGGEGTSDFYVGGRNGMFGKKHTIYTKMLISKANTGKVATDKQRQAASIRFKGKKQSVDFIERRKVSLMGHFVSEETKKKIGNANRGKVRPLDAIRRTAEKQTGQKRSLQGRENISSSLSKYWEEVRRARMFLLALLLIGGLSCLNTQE